MAPADPRHVWGGFYEPGTLIWTSRWITRDQVIHSREVLTYPGAEHRAVLLRQIHAVEGDATVEVALDVRAGYGRHSADDLRRDRHGWHGRAGALRWRWTGAATARPDADGVLRARLRVPAGQHVDLILEIGDREWDEAPDAGQAWRRTEAAWADRPARLDGCLAHRDATHALAVLRGMTHPDGGMAAAATLGLPERAHAGSSYDYRYAWIRDQCYAGQAAAAAQAPDLLDAAVRFVSARLLDDGPGLAPAYTVSPTGPVPDERPLPSVPGYPGGVAITGNRVNSQFQLDVFGESLLLLAAAARADRLEAAGADAMRVAGDAIAATWTGTDSGVWELEKRRWTHSRFACVAGLRAAADALPDRHADDWRALADRIMADTVRHHVHPTGRWKRARGDGRIDAALLMAVVRGATPPDDPRSLATIAAVHRELRQDDYVYRFKPDARPLGQAEGAFLLCGFALANAAHRIGDPVTAARLFERSRAACGPAGIYAEEYDVTQRQLRGNVPQAFVHAMMLDTALTLSGPPGPAAS